MIQKHQAVMDVREQVGNHVHWTQTVEEGDVVSTVSYVQAVEAWEAMGSPDVITVTVEPSDTLNVESPRLVTEDYDPRFDIGGKVVEMPVHVDD